MSTLTASNRDVLLDEYMAMSDSDHMAAMHSLKGDIGERLLRLGKAVYAWKKKGNSLDDLGMNGMTHWLLMVGGDELYAPLLAKLMNRKDIALKLSKLSFTEQKLIGDGSTVDLLLLNKSGGADVIQVSPLEVSDPEVLNQILAKDHIRTVGEQRVWIEANRQKAAKPVPSKIGNLAPDPELDGCKFLGKHGDFISADTLAAALRACRKK